MTATASARTASPTNRARWFDLSPTLLRTALPFVSLALMLVAIGWLNPRAISYMGFNLMLSLAIPVALATIAQMFVITVNELDLSAGLFISFITSVSVTMLNDTPLLGIAVIAGAVLVYAAVGALIHLRNLPSIVVTLGMAFVWQGLALMVLPQPGGRAPAWLQSLMAVHIPFVPFPIVAAVVIALVVHLALMKTSYGAVLRGIGGNQAAVARAGWSILHAKVLAFTLAGVFGVLSALALVGLSTAGDPNIGAGYTLLAIAGVILGGGEFMGGRVSAVGAVAGALTLTLASASLLSFMHIPTDWQTGANGLILIVVLALRAMIDRRPA
ncbi:ABC transporter permease [Mesorhizobium sp. ESP6-5]|uniref:ABC transporter permease n=1 Tax=Mesorhizobium sp. ESP6-5 TaxID=2876623 RepID=UPI001CCADDEC|nr:ABC transporter permease [Mesorhizobium sp. ESP6-5]MBZ9758175.1 ABC transporter permease [Mesorhizobium sp. ESP6-5]